jgi:hypothetical protein
LQPVVDLSGGGLPEIVLATYNDSLLKRSDVTGSFGGTLTLNTGTGYPNKFVSLTDYPAPNPALQPDNANPINTGDNRLSANVIMANGELWATQSVLSEAGRDAIRWLRIDPLTNNVKQEGLISDLNWDFYFASVSVNPSGAVVIGFSGSTDILEPSSLALLALGLAGLWPYSRRHLPH